MEAAAKPAARANGYPEKSALDIKSRDLYKPVPRMMGVANRKE